MKLTIGFGAYGVLSLKMCKSMLICNIYGNYYEAIR